MIGTLNSTALAGIHKGLDELQKNASQIASKSTLEGGSTQSLAESLVGLRASTQQVEASMKVLQVSDQLIGSLIDIKA